MKTKYEVIETSTGKFRIRATDELGERFIGGKRSRNFCYTTRDQAMQMVGVLLAGDARIAKFDESIAETDKLLAESKALREKPSADACGFVTRPCTLDDIDLGRIGAALQLRAEACEDTGDKRGAISYRRAMEQIEPIRIGNRKGFTAAALERIDVAIRLRAEACEENDETKQAADWRETLERVRALGK